MNIVAISLGLAGITAGFNQDTGVIQVKITIGRLGAQAAWADGVELHPAAIAQVVFLGVLYAVVGAHIIFDMGHVVQ